MGDFYLGSDVGLPGGSQPYMAVVEIAFAASPYTMPSTSTEVHVDTSGGNVIINMPAASSVRKVRYVVKKTTADANTVTVTRAGADTIDGAATAVLLGGTRGSLGLTGPLTGADFKVT